MIVTRKNQPLYRAAKPTMTRRALFWFVLWRVLFPVILLWDALKFIGNFLFGRFIGRLILPASTISAETANETLFAAEAIDCQTKMVGVMTHDGALLDTIEITPKSSLAPKKYIIHLLGNADYYENNIAEMAEEANEHQCTVVGFNYRGVGQSSKKHYAQSKNDLMIDAIASVQRLLDKGVDPKNILLKGWSLGGALATLTAKHFHDRGKKIYVFNDRSFSSFTNVAVGWVRMKNWTDISGHETSRGKKLLGWIAKPIIAFILAFTKWEMNVAAAFKALPATHKDYLVMRSPKGARMGNQDDFVITHYASLHMALKSKRRAFKMRANAAEKAAFKTQNGTRKHITLFGNAHCAPLSVVKNRFGQTGEEHFGNFVRRCSL